ncbi:MAG: protein kinase [Gemmataceae bacterium]|nr:protein kinase [Gemmataceae bacterium]
MQQAPAPPRRAGDEPVPGYRLLSPLGQGGFGEVWKCEAPGGIFKAVKFVGAGDEGACPAAQELAALQKIKSLRHPFILSLDRIEVVDGTLVLVMELADQNLSERHAQCAAEGLPGIPRHDLLGYLREAAEALDWMSFEHGLQHLDVKPHNLFLISDHVKVADFGLVDTLGEGGEGTRRQAGVTPLYSAPELLRGNLSRSSDQYSLAVVYQQMLTGSLPFWNSSVYELMMLHLTGEPDLSRVPPGDHPALLRALSKVPDQRFSSCSEFIEALASVPGASSASKRSGLWRRMLSGPRAEAPPAPPAPPSPSAMLAQTRLTLDETPTKRVRSVARETPSGLEPGPAVTRPTLPAPIVPPPVVPGTTPLPTAVSLPGYRFLSCASQTALGDIWLAEDSAGNPRRGLALLGYVRYDARLIAHLQALRDPALAPTEVHWSPAERLVLLTDPCEGSLRDLFDRSVAEGGHGVARERLLALLRTAAEALDRLSSRHGIQHLGLNPRNLLVDGGQLRIADFGVIPLVWLPTGESAAAINGRYSAPELFERRATASADQYSLALIYAEMLTGIHPRPQRPEPVPGIHRRPGTGGKSGFRPRVAKLDLDLVPSHDREALQQALSHEPGKRFSSCLAFVEALEKAGAPAAPSQNLYLQLPGVIPYRSLMGEPPGPDTLLPGVGQLVVCLADNDRRDPGPPNSRYRVLPDGSWEYRCPMQLFPGAMAVKMAGFVAYWHARVLKQEGESYKLDMEVPGQKPSIWNVFRASQRIQVDVEVQPASGQGTRLTEARVAVRYEAAAKDQAVRVLSHLSPKIFETVRTCFQATAEQRERERWSVSVPVRLHPVLPDLELAEAIEASARNVSFGGMSLRAASVPPVDRLYLHLHGSPQTADWAVLARVVRCVPAEGGCEIGVRFLDRGE